jgi:hypothetical protein
MLTASRYLALVFALVLAVVEAWLNASRPNGWQYAPLWIIDYVIVAALLVAFWLTRRPGHTPLLMSGWALAAGVFYTVLFASLDPESQRPPGPPAFLLFLIGLGLAVQVVGLILAGLALYRAGASSALKRVDTRQARE